MNRHQWNWLRHSTTARFVLLYLTLSVAGIVPVLFFIYHQTDRIVVNTYKATIEDEQANLLRSQEIGGIDELAKSIRDRITSGAAAHGVILVVDRAGRRIAGNIAAWPPTLRKPTKWTQMRLYRSGHAQAELFALSTIHFPSGHRLLIGTLVEERHRMRDALLIALVGAFVLAIPIGLFGGYLLVRFMNDRVRAVAAVAANVAKGELAHRVPTHGTKDPFDELGNALNAMLARIENLVEDLRMVTDGLAHDLRSPLMRMRAAAEKALREQGQARTIDAIDAIGREIETMLHALSLTLEVSRAEAGIGRENFAPVDLAQLARDLCDMYQPLLEEQGTQVRVDAPEAVSLEGSRQLLGQALSNLIDNAMKYGAAGGTIEIGISGERERVRLWVSDSGLGIPEEHRADAIKRYRRLDPSRSAEGAGLGLALVAAVARLHGGELQLQDNRPGLRAVLLLPRQAG